MKTLNNESYQESHPCEHSGCQNSVSFDDEPYCFKHSSDSGSFVLGYSYKAKHSQS